MRIFVYESLVAGGLFAGGISQGDLADPSHDEPRSTKSLTSEMPSSLMAEGMAMFRALAADFAALPGTKVAAVVALQLVDQLADLPVHCVNAGSRDERVKMFDRLAAESDWTIVIAPEIGGELAATCRRVVALGGRLLGPSIELIELASDKHRMAEHLRQHGVAAPKGCVIVGGQSPSPVDLSGIKFPAVLKPVDGAGSLGVQLVRGASDIAPSPHPRRFEEFCPGTPASAAVLCGHGRFVAFPACTQRLGGDGFTYLGGSLPLPAALAERAESLVIRAVATFDAPLGYIGVDLVLGSDPNGRQDRVIEVNPRLTTSYIGLRRLACGNLAAALVAVASGNKCELSFASGKVEFDAEGTAWDRQNVK